MIAITLQLYENVPEFSYTTVGGEILFMSYARTCNIGEQGLRGECGISPAAFIPNHKVINRGTNKSVPLCLCCKHADDWSLAQP